MAYLIALPLMLILSTTLTYVYIRHAHRKNWLDVPNARSSHTQLTPRGGGLVFVMLWLISVGITGLFHLWTWQNFFALIPGAVIVAATGFYDDRHSLSPRTRAWLYLLAALISVCVLGGIAQFKISAHTVLTLSWAGSIVAVLAVLWSINLFNFMDGLDGIAAVEALFVLGVGGFFLYQSQGQTIAFIAWLLAAGVAGFLVWNKPRAKVFMGDVGSTLLGFVIMVLALLGEKLYGVPALLWLILYAVFIFDATVTLLRRLFAKERIFQAHRLHAYQRLHQAGLSHGKVLLGVSVVNLVLAILAVIGFYYPMFLPVLILLAFILLAILYWRVEVLKPMYSG